MNKCLILGITILAGIGFSTSTHAAVQTNKIHRVKTESKLKKPGDYVKVGKMSEQYISTGKIASFNQGTMKYTKAYYDIYKYNNLTTEAAEELPAPDNGSIPHHKVAYFLKIGTNATNTSDKEVHQNGFLYENYMTPQNQQVDLTGSMSTDTIAGDYNPHAIKKNKATVLYLGSSNNKSAKIVKHGTYTFKSDSLLNSDDYTIAEGFTIKVDPLSGKNITIQSTPVEQAHGTMSSD
ncbi:hypothetical protein [Loigolactobacillus backii]|uniref:hypothetical protein n=1 Tax=Loigolactobacillus backii TaxID=375175 RepID=UPI0007F0993B|nr:hypothetical protein [Loigolactobacillus backii]ANK59854.1 hypothetical protein AYR52_06015 [Loigolactobacillus backii]